MSRKVHFDDAPIAPPAYSPPPAYAMHDFSDGVITFAQKERMAAIAEAKLGFLVSQKRREPSLRRVLLHAGFLEKVLDSLDASTPEEADEPMIDEEPAHIAIPEIHASLSTIVEEEEEERVMFEEEMDVDEEDEEDEDMPALTRTVSHRPVSPPSSDSEDDEDSDDEFPSPPPQYSAPDHPLISLFEVREKARREDLPPFIPQSNDMFLMTNGLAVAA